MDKFVIGRTLQSVVNMPHRGGTICGLYTVAPVATHIET